MTELGAWTFSVYQKHKEEFNKETATLSQAILLCYICCVSEVARVKSRAKWFTRTIDEMSADLDLSESKVCTELGVLRGAMLTESKKVSVGTKMRLLLRADSKALKRFDFIRDEVNGTSMVDVFAKELVPMDEIIGEVTSCFGVG